MVSELVSTFRSAYPLFRFLCFRLFVCVVFIPYVRICCVESVFVIFVLGLCSFRARSVFLSIKKKKKKSEKKESVEILYFLLITGVCFRKSILFSFPIFGT